MEDNSKTLTSILDYLLIALRYVASGFVALGAYAYLDYPTISEMKDVSGLLVFAAATIGIVTYALHFATLDKILYGECVFRYLKNYNYTLPEILIKQINIWESEKGELAFNFRKFIDQRRKSDSKDQNKSTESSKSLDQGISGFIRNRRQKYFIIRRVLFSLANQSYLRSLSNNRMLAEMQKQVEKRLALLNFLYCSMYQILIITVYFTFSKMPLRELICSNFIDKLILLSSVAVFFGCSAWRFNRRICEREMWLVQNFSLEVDEIKKGDQGQ